MPLANGCFFPALLCLFAYSVVAVEPLVDLSYSTFEGTSLTNGITQWLGIPFAAPPINELRFAPPNDPPSKTGVQQANKVREYPWLIAA